MHLMGEAAFWYVKARDVNVFGSADMRLARQKQYLNAYVQAARSAVKKDITVALDLYQAVVPQMVTDISADEVAYLAPTTILAQQIYNTFSQRMKDFPVRVDLLCRFRTAAQQKKTISDLKKGRPRGPDRSRGPWHR